MPLLALHSEADAIVPFETQRRFVDSLRGHYRERGADEALIRLHTWSETGPAEHAGFGRFRNEPNLQTEYLVSHLGHDAAAAGA